MKADLPVCQLARVTLQTISPVSISVGRGDGLQDVLVVRDAQGLPTLPGTAIAGVLRHLFYDATENEEMVRSVFGFAGTTSQPSRLETTWGKIHDAQDRPVDAFDQRIALDNILSPLLNDSLPLRDGVRLNERGAAMDAGKYDRSYVPIGHRFTFDIVLWSNEQDEAFDILLKAMHSPRFRLGGGTRRGFGAFRVHQIRQGCFDLRVAADLQRYARLTARLGDAIDLPVSPLAGEEADDCHSIELKLSPEDGGYRFGSGNFVLGHANGKAPDALPLSEQVVMWEGGTGRIASQRQLAIPASSIKGALSHRVAFHYNRIHPDDPQVAESNRAVQELFGYSKDGKGGDSFGEAGKVWIDDVVLPLDASKLATHQHTSIDRFTGGVRAGVLFSEQVVHGHPFVLKLRIARQREIRADALRALRLALEDLAEGRLALGASAAKGHGYFSGTLDWPIGLPTGEQA